MTLVQVQHRPAVAAPAHRTATGAVDTDGPQVCDDMTVEVALSVLAGARVGHLLVCDDDGLCTGLVTQAQLAAVRDSPAYTDQVQLRDIFGQPGQFTSPVTPVDEAEHALHHRRSAARPGRDIQGRAAGVPALTR
ncbi:CBS domain-containing protein [Kitasatospora sp. NPDC059571]|uniref:CBS domain-containing protein n=1 Tax=Kitasatospora sp. NPDC059571 TaxID=3346871 RepID=UPI003682B2B5